MAIRTTLMLTHLILLLLASTFFTIIPGFGDRPLRWEYFRYAWQTGRGVPYEFPYALTIVLTYLAAYSVGMCAYWLAMRGGSRAIGLAGLLLCGLGLASFAYELTHWLSAHYGTLIVSTPIALSALGPVAIVQQWRLHASPTATA